MGQAQCESSGAGTVHTRRAHLCCANAYCTLDRFTVTTPFTSSTIVLILLLKSNRKSNGHHRQKIELDRININSFTLTQRIEYFTCRSGEQNIVRNCIYFVINMTPVNM